MSTEDDLWFYEPELDFGDFAGALVLADQLYPHQRAVYDDPSRQRAVQGTRRAGKTELDGAEALSQAESFPGETIPFCGPTLSRAREILWPILDRIVQRTGLKLDYAEGGDICRLPGGGKIQLFGLGTMREVEKGRGQRYPMVIITEAGAVPQHHLQQAVQVTFGPATADFRNKGGRGILVEGSPSPIPSGFWHDLSGGQELKSKFGWSTHRLMIDDNPFFDDFEAVLLDERERNNWDELDPDFLREWRCRWIYNSKGLCYGKWNKQYLPRNTIPQSGYTTLGLDLGNDHPCAWIPTRLCQTTNILHERIRVQWNAHVLDAYEESGCDVHDVARITKEFVHNYHVGQIVGDSGGLGSMVIQDLNRAFNLPIDRMPKAGYKRDRIWFTNSMFGAGTLFVHEGAETLGEQLNTLVWNDKRDDHHPMQPDHSADALHGALQDCLQQTFEADAPPAPGTRQARLLASMKDIQATIARLRGVA